MIQRAWKKEGTGGRLLHELLRPPAAAYSTVVRLRALLYKLRIAPRRRLRAGVVSIGNLTVGGTGKTPTALWVAERLSDRGLRVAIVSRGYGGSAAGPTRVDPDGDWRVFGDEPIVLARRFAGPVIVARRRFGGGRLATQELGCDCLVLDDGFQHLPLARDFDLVLVRAGTLRNLATLPAGPFREPPGAIGRAHAVLFTKGEEDEPPEPWLERKARHRPIFRGTLRAKALVTTEGGVWRELPLGRLAGRPALALAGIGDPDSFFRTLWEWEARIEDFLEYPDHHEYTLEDWKSISAKSRGFDLVVTTEKDLVKLDRFPFAREKLVAVRVDMEVEDGETLIDQIVDRIGGKTAKAHRGR